MNFSVPVEFDFLPSVTWLYLSFDTCGRTHIGFRDTLILGEKSWLFGQQSALVIFLLCWTRAVCTEYSAFSAQETDDSFAEGVALAKELSVSLEKSILPKGR